MATFRARSSVLQTAQPTKLNLKRVKTEPPDEEHSIKRRLLDLPAARRPATPARPNRYTFSIKVAKQDAAPVAFETITLLSRPKVPLYWLDQNPSTITSVSRSLRAFPAHLSPLEYDTDVPRVLIVSSVSDKRLYAIERVKPELYTASLLATQVRETDIYRAADRCASAPEPWTIKGTPGSEIEQQCAPTFDKDAWWKDAVIHKPSAAEKKVSKRQAMIASLKVSCAGTMRKSGGQAGAVGSDGAAPVAAAVSSEAAVNGSTDISSTPTETAAAAEPFLTTEDALNMVRSSYAEALYISKASVAYFAKGPLTRSRNLANITMDELCTFYRERILPVKKFDHKYRDGVPSAIRTFPISTSEDERDSPTKAATAKKRKGKKKTKLGKNCLWPDEEDYVKQWWTARPVTESSDGIRESIETELKRLTSDLRLRETQLQILLILETVALERSPKTTTQGKAKVDETAAKAKKESKKPQDLQMLLDLHLDRLCIWQAVDLDTILTVEKTGQDNGSSTKRVRTDAVRDFCTEVIVPFYAARLPDHCKSISQKLGGPSIASPPRPSLQKSSSASQIAPGAMIKRPPLKQPVKKPRSLQRVLTDDKIALQARSGVPSLTRSSTAPDLKRESLSREPSLPPRLASRGGISTARRLDNREVDLAAAAKQHESKIKRMQRMLDSKKELQDAIQSIRKPNRTLVSQHIADESQQRISTSSKKKRPPVRNALGQGAELNKNVQVTATPRKPRRPDLFGSQYGLPSVPSMFVRSPPPRRQRYMHEGEAFGSDFVIPSSTIKPSASTSVLRPLRSGAGLDAVLETPSRGPSKHSDPLGLTLGDHNLTSQPSNAAQTTPTRKRSCSMVQDPAQPNHTDNAEIMQTPDTSVKRRRLGLFKSATISTPQSFVTPVKRNQALSAAVPTNDLFATPELPRAKATASLGSKTIFTPQAPLHKLHKQRREDTTIPFSSPPLLNVSASNSAPVMNSLQQMKGGTFADEDDIYGALGWDNDDDLDDMAF